MYVSIDIETTGLNPDTDQILEVAAVIDDRSRRVKDCPTFQAVIRHDRLSGDPRALEMNADLISAIAGGIGMHKLDLGPELRFFLEDYSDGEKYTAMGKNFGSFDWQFLKRMDRFPVDMFSHRFLEVGSLYAQSSGIQSLTDLSESIAEEFEIEGEAHQAEYDAKVTLALARLKWRIAA